MKRRLNYASATTADFSGKYLYLPIEEYELSRVKRDSYELFHASLMYAYSNCKEATVAFYIKQKSTEDVVSNTLYITGYDSNKYQKVNYLSRYILQLGDMQLMAKTASSHMGYYVTGEWNPNGGLE